MKLQPASQMSKIAEENYEKFKESVLESEEFESLKMGIEEAANEGKKHSNTKFILIVIHVLLIFLNRY